MVGIYDCEKWYYIEFEGGHVFVCGKYVKRIYHKKTEAAGQPLSFAFFGKGVYDLCCPTMMFFVYNPQTSNAYAAFENYGQRFSYRTVDANPFVLRKLT